jgi:hypothetical protein
MRKERRGRLLGNGRWVYVALVPALLLAISAGVVLSESTGEYVVISWSDEGTGFSNSDFSTFALFPPYSTLKAQVIRKGLGGAMPSLVGRDVLLTYEIPGNTYSAGKTNFWDYAESLFGVQLEPDMGLTGRGMNGPFGIAPGGDHFEAEGIPATPYMDFDLGNEDPYQLAFVNLFSQEGDFLSHAEPVIAVTNEISCSTCHLSDVSIITAHPNVQDFDTSKPILCASCHASNVYGTQGIPRARSLSERIHQSHNDKTNNCQVCHPGPKSRPFRGVMSTQHGMICQDCHGNMAGVAESIGHGRRPWLDEPKCGTCHGDRYSEEPGKLFRDSRGHGGLYCSACHGASHAILPSREPRENVQNIVLQGFPGTLRDCGVCHEQVPAGPGPHKIGQ